MSKLLPCICSYIPCIWARLPSIVSMMVKASLIQGRTHAFNTSSLCCAASTCSFSALAYCICTSLWVRATVYVVPLTLSYCYWSSHTSISKRLILGSSCRLVRTSNDSSNILVQSLTALPISSNPTVIVLARCSLTSEGVDGYAFNCNSPV